MNNLKLRNAIFSDSKLLLDWANDMDMRSNSFNSQKITMEEHEKWYSKKLNDSNNAAIFILELSDKPIGQIRFERNSRGCSVDYFIAQDERGKGYGKRIVQMGIEEIKSSWENIDYILAEVKKDNKPSSKVFIHLNFVETIFPDKYLYTLKV
ncbi:MAG: GNAT family N-acetyltransferase [Ignavibacteriae bacterium]|nr:GNAT family N-acetyltransferase [Ignavibacteriota bacterium]